MTRLHAVVEGQTEETFVNRVLAPEFWALDVFVDVHCVTTGRKRGISRGGISRYEQLKTDLTLWMKEDQRPDAWFTTMVDLYAPPEDFPGFDDCTKNADPIRRVECLEERLHNDLADRRFIPYIQLHEFEALLFSDPRHFESAFPRDATVVRELTAIRNEFPTPEYIDDGPGSAPSQRILALRPDYKKTVAGLQVVQQIGFATLLRECAHFNQWIGRIEMAATR